MLVLLATYTLGYLHPAPSVPALPLTRRHLPSSSSVLAVPALPHARGDRSFRVAAWTRAGTPSFIRTPPPVASMLPAIGPQHVWRTAAVAGLTALTAQLGLTAILRRHPDKAWSSKPGIVAYRLVALIFGSVLTFMGGALFLNPACWPTTAAAVMTGHNGSVRVLGAVLFGQLVLWDLPTAAFIKRLRRPDLILHHVGLALVAFIAMRFMPLFYYSWFIGLSEASTLPLAANDLFDELHRNVEESDANSPRLPGLASWRDYCQYAASASFVLVRVLGWAWVVFLLFRDTLAVLPSAASIGVRGLLRLQLGFAAAFYALQLFWLKKLVAYTMESGLGGAVPDDTLTWQQGWTAEEEA